MSYASAGMAAISLANGVMQQQAASRAGNAARQAASTNAAYQINEANRLEGQVNTQAGQEMGDRAMQAARDASTLRVMLGERGATANAASRSMQELGYFEGMDLSRIEQNRKNQFAALESRKNAALVGETNDITIANNQEQSASTGAFLGTLGSLVQIGANDYKTQSYNYILAGGNPKNFHYKPFGIGS